MFNFNEVYVNNCFSLMDHNFGSVSKDLFSKLGVSLLVSSYFELFDNVRLIQLFFWHC
jgi:hypothetical protein